MVKSALKPHVRAHHQEGHVEADLVVAGAGGAVGDGVRADLIGVAGDGHALEDTLGGHGDRVGAIAEHVTVDHVFEALGVVFLRDVEGHVLGGAQLVGVLLVGLQLLGAESAGVGAGGVHLVAFLFGQVHHRVGGVQTSAEGDDDFLFLFHICFYFRSV